MSLARPQTHWQTVKKKEKKNRTGVDCTNHDGRLPLLPTFNLLKLSTSTCFCNCYVCYWNAPLLFKRLLLFFSQFSGHFPVSKTLLLDALILAPQSKTNNSLLSATAFLKKNKKEDVLFKESWFFPEYVENALIDGLKICCKVQNLLLMSCDLSYWQILWDLGWVVQSPTTCKLNQD